MCVGGNPYGNQYSNSAQAVAANTQGQQTKSTVRPAERMAELFNLDLNVTLAPHDLEYFIRNRWDEIAKLAHKIHEGRS